MTTQEIKSQATLEAWLKGQSREFAIIIAHRAALRVTPLYWRRAKPASKNSPLDPIPLLWLLLHSEVCLRSNKAKLAKRNLPKYADFDSYSYADVVEARFDQQSRTALAARAAEESSKLVFSNSDMWIKSNSLYSLMKSEQALERHMRSSTASFLFWSEIANDISKLTAADFGCSATQGIRLWQDARHAANDACDEVISSWRSAEHGWQFWADWYDAILEGRPLLGDWDFHRSLITEIALSDAEIWNNGPDKVNPAVGMVFKKHDIRRQADGLDADYARIRREVFATQSSSRDQNSPPELLELAPHDFERICEAATTAHDAVVNIGNEAGKENPDPHVLQEESDRLLAALQIALRYLGRKADLGIETLIKWGVPAGMTWLLANQIRIENLAGCVRSLIGSP